jgi:hypothetical protein
MRKRGLSLEAHNALGEALKALSRRLVEIECNILNAYPLRVARGAKRVQAGPLPRRARACAWLLPRYPTPPAIPPPNSSQATIGGHLGVAPRDRYRPWLTPQPPTSRSHTAG